MNEANTAIKSNEVANEAAKAPANEVANEAAINAPAPANEVANEASKAPAINAPANESANDASKAKSESSELDWLFNLIDSISKGTFNPIKWPEFFKLPTPPLFVLIEMMDLARKYVHIKVNMRELELKKLDFEFKSIQSKR